MIWMPDLYWYNTVEPLPFGHVEDLPRDDWRAAVRRIKPDVIYALLNVDRLIAFFREVIAQDRR